MAKRIPGRGIRPPRKPPVKTGKFEDEDLRGHLVKVHKSPRPQSGSKRSTTKDQRIPMPPKKKPAARKTK